MSQQTQQDPSTEPAAKDHPPVPDEKYRRLYSERVVITVTLLLSLGAVVALAVFLQFDAWGLSLFRILIITLFTILPAVMYYVFIASRKQSLLQEFVSNLNRLGLLRVHDENCLPADDDKIRYFRRTRILSYIDRFESVYGPVGKQSKKDLLKASSCDIPADAQDSNAQASRGQIFSPATAMPVFVATFLIGLGWIQFIPPWVDTEIVENPGNATMHSALLYNELPALFAFLGAYFFSLQMIYRRYVTNDLRASAYISVSIRIVLGVIGAWLLQVVFKIGILGFDSDIYWLLFTSFVIGVFPPVLWQIIRKASNRLLLLAKVVPRIDSVLPLNTLDGLTIWHETRLEEEDIENAYNMANADIIALLVNTKMPPERIVDWVDQAILHACLGTPEDNDSTHAPSLLRQLQHHGIGKASALTAAVASAASRDQLPQANAIDFRSDQLLSLANGINSFSNLALIGHWRAQYLTDRAFETMNPDMAQTANKQAELDKNKIPAHS